MDGTNRSVIVEEKITWPNGLTLDFVNDRIYWADAREDYIAFASLDGTSRHTSNTHTYTQRHNQLVNSLSDVVPDRCLWVYAQSL